jgi:large subunit ribosomal protein L7/L12
MSDEAATIAPELAQIGDKIAELTLKQAKELSDYLEQKYGIKPAAGGAVMMAAPSGDEGGGGAKQAEQTEFDVVLTNAGDKKTGVIKVVKALTGMTLMDAKKLVDAVPAKIKEKVSKDDAEKAKVELEKEGASVELK